MSNNGGDAPPTAQPSAQPNLQPNSPPNPQWNTQPSAQWNTQQSAQQNTNQNAQQNTQPNAQSNEQREQADRHEQLVEEREAESYWGYLFKTDKTGTDKLKALLRGLKDVINTHYEPSENPDLTPSQLASFYRDLYGNYDQLFLGTPSETIAFIYKSLGCLHSLQPLPHSTAFTEPTVPALKTEGWIMWQTIQLLLGPEEHSGFLMEAVEKWDVKDPATGEIFPRILPRQCFPMEPDKHMVAWYEGVSERLRREAEDEERQREVEAEQAEVRRLHYRKRDDGNDDESVDSRRSALAYFRDPLYRDRQDGRPTIVNRNSKRPQLSPRRSSMKDKAKEGATSFGHVIRNIGSPHLWDGRGGKNENRDRSKDRRRRSSLPENRYHHSNDGPPSSGHDSRTPSYNSGHGHHRRERSRQGSRPDATAADDADDEVTPIHSRGESASRHRHRRDDSNDQSIRPSRSHEPTPTQTEITDYFQNYKNPSGNNSHNVTPNGVGPSFEPSASPLFASHIAKQPQPPPPRQPHPQAEYGPSRSSRQGPPPPDRRHYSRSPEPSQRPRSRNDRQYGSRERRRYDPSPGRPPYDGPGPTSAPPPGQQSGYPPSGSDSNRPPSGAPPYPSPGHGQPGFSIPGGPMPTRERRRSGRMSGSDLSGYSAGEDGRRGSGPQKQTRFASVSGVDGRRYPDGTPWR